jgi:hypothetical protein
MVKIIQDIFQLALEYLEINPQPAFVKPLRDHGRPHDPVVAVQVFARAVVIAQPVRGAELGFGRYFEHGVFSVLVNIIIYNMIFGTGWWGFLF